MFNSILSEKFDVTEMDVSINNHLVTFLECLKKANRVKSLSAGLKEISQNKRGNLAQTVLIMNKRSLPRKL